MIKYAIIPLVLVAAILPAYADTNSTQIGIVISEACIILGCLDYTTLAAAYEAREPTRPEYSKDWNVIQARQCLSYGYCNYYTDGNFWLNPDPRLYGYLDGIIFVERAVPEYDIDDKIVPYNSLGYEGVQRYRYFSTGILADSCREVISGPELQFIGLSVWYLSTCDPAVLETTIQKKEIGSRVIDSRTLSPTWNYWQAYENLTKFKHECYFC